MYPSLKWNRNPRKLSKFFLQLRREIIASFPEFYVGHALRSKATEQEASLIQFWLINFANTILKYFHLWNFFANILKISANRWKSFANVASCWNSMTTSLLQYFLILFLLLVCIFRLGCIFFYYSSFILDSVFHSRICLHPLECS